MQLADVNSALDGTEGWHRTVEAHAPRLWRLAAGSGLSPGAAAEVCELAFLRLGQLRERGPADPGPWLDAVVRRESAAWLRQATAPHRLAAARTA